MYKALIVALGVASLATLSGVQLASAAQDCKIVCDQWAPDNWGNPRCFSAHRVCTKQPVSNGPGAQQAINDRKLRRQN